MTELKVKATEFLTAIKRVKHCIGENEAQKNLMGVNLSVTADNPEILRVTAADSFRIARQKISIEKTEAFSVTICSSPIIDSTLEGFLKPYRMGRYNKIEAILEVSIVRLNNKQYLNLQPDISNTRPFKTKINAFDYPELDRLIENNRSENNKIVLGKGDIRHIYKGLDYLWSVAKKYRDVLRISISDGGEHYWKSELYNTNWLTLGNTEKTAEVRLRINTGNVKLKEHIGLNIHFLKQAFQVFKTNKAANLTLTYGDSEKPLYMNSDLEGFEQSVLPVKLKS